jgi:hypothetical protein
MHAAQARVAGCHSRNIGMWTGVMNMKREERVPESAGVLVVTCVVYVLPISKSSGMARGFVNIRGRRPHDQLFRAS